MKEMMVKIKNHGTITIALNEEIAPIAVKSVLEMIEKRKYDGKVIERLEPAFVIQPLFQDGVDPEIDKMIEPEYELREDNHNMKFVRGTVAMAGDGKNASGSQYFITLSEREHLNGKFTVIGEVIDGWDEIERLENVPVTEYIDEPTGFKYHTPTEDEIVESVRIK